MHCVNEHKSKRLRGNNTACNPYCQLVYSLPKRKRKQELKKGKKENKVNSARRNQAFSPSFSNVVAYLNCYVLIPYPRGVLLPPTKQSYMNKCCAVRVH